MYYSIRYFGEVREHLPQYEGHFCMYCILIMSYSHQKMVSGDGETENALSPCYTAYTH